jgi:hypothetical protein
MGSIALGLMLLVGTFVVMQYVRPRDGRPAPSWARNGAANSSLALVIVIGFVAGIAFFISGVLDFA